jgi:hypothetical protein
VREQMAHAVLQRRNTLPQEVRAVLREHSAGQRLHTQISTLPSAPKIQGVALERQGYEGCEMTELGVDAADAIGLWAC